MNQVYESKKNKQNEGNMVYEETKFASSNVRCLRTKKSVIRLQLQNRLS